MSFCWIGVDEKDIQFLKINSYVKAQTFPMSQKYMMGMDENEYEETFGERKGFITSINHKSVSDITIFDTTLNKEVSLVPATCKMSVSIYKLKKRYQKETSQHSLQYFCMVHMEILPRKFCNKR